MYSSCFKVSLNSLKYFICIYGSSKHFNRRKPLEVLINKVMLRIKHWSTDTNCINNRLIRTVSTTVSDTLSEVHNLKTIEQEQQYFYDSTKNVKKKNYNNPTKVIITLPVRKGFKQFVLEAIFQPNHGVIYREESWSIGRKRLDHFNQCQKDDQIQNIKYKTKTITTTITGIRIGLTSSLRMPFKCIDNSSCQKNKEFKNFLISIFSPERIVVCVDIAGSNENNIIKTLTNEQHKTSYNTVELSGVAKGIQSE